MNRNTNFSEHAIKSFNSYCDDITGEKGGFIAVPFQLGRGQTKTRYCLFDAQTFKSFVSDESLNHLFRERAGILVWKGLDALAPSNKISLGALEKLEKAHKDFPNGIRNFEIEGMNRLSDSQEMIVKTWLENEVFTSELLEWTGTRLEEGRYNPDVITSTGIQIEVKGKSSNLGRD